MEICYHLGKGEKDWQFLYELKWLFNNKASDNHKTVKHEMPLENNDFIKERTTCYSYLFIRNLFEYRTVSTG